MTLRFEAPDDDGKPSVASPSDIDAGLLRWCETDAQTEAVQAVIDIGSITHAARHLGKGDRNFRRLLGRIQARAALQGHAPASDNMRHPTPEGFAVKRRSARFDKEGNPVGGWVISEPDKIRQMELLKEGIRAFMEERGPVTAPTFACPNPETDVVPWLQIGDAHIGMLAHEAEAGADFNIQIAEREICAAFKIIIDDLPPCDRLVINDLGDSTHFENTEKQTSGSRHPLDGERPRLMIRAISRIMRFLVDLALTKARVVDVIVNQGNHSRFGDFWLNEMLSVAYLSTDRVNILDNENVFIGYRMGNTLVMVHHSDKCSIDRLPGVMMEDFKQDFAETEFHYIDIGHIHHKMTVKEKDGCVTESWNTLARGDKWHRESGYRARQSMSVVLRSRTYGEVGRRTVPIQMIYDAIRSGHTADGLAYLPKQRRAFAA